ncbi:MAG: ExeM/NucH family extracellular endonuclease [Anaerolineaceae bacterium]|nr:ExeM/NucH family extracellular endonuclease [Anaerolineaceae bacterium]
MHIRTRLFNLVLILGMLFGALGVVTQEASAASITDLFISEYIEGGSFNKAIEIFNGTGAPVDLSQYSIELYSNGASSPTASTALSGTLADGDVFVIANASAVSGILDVADMTSSVINFNGDDAFALRKGTAFIDVIGQIGLDPAAGYWGSGDVTTANDTLVRQSEVCTGDTDGSDAFDPTSEWNGYAQDTFDYLGGHTCDCYSTSIDPVINEFSASTTGTDVEYLELYGEPETDYSNLTILAVEGDDPNWGVIDGAFAMGTTDTNGFYLANLVANDLENGTQTFLLVSNFIGLEGDDIDTSNDGVIDATPWEAILDAVAVNDGGTTDLNYGVPVLTALYDGLSYTPGGASRIPDGLDTDAASDWVRNDYDLAGIPGYTGSIGLHEAYNTPGATNVEYEPPPEACGDEYTAIYDIQGNGASSPLSGSEVATEGIVVGDYQDGGKNGFFIQDADGDGDLTTSDGVWVYAPSAPDVMIGDHVRVRGSVTEYYDLTEIGSVSQVWICATEQTLPTAGVLTLPMASEDAFEPFEGMRVTFPQDLVISEYFNFDRYGEVVLTSTRHVTPTALYEPGSPEYTAAVAAYALDEITLDDGRTSQNPDPALHPDGAVFDMSHLFRGGSWVTNLTAVLDYSYGAYKLQPSEGGTYYDANQRIALPTVYPGDLTIASFNVLNYFVTLDDGVNDICGPSGDMECRGADTAEELTRQRDKIVAAMAAIDADVFGLMEIENDRLGGDTDAAVFDLVNSLNAVVGAGTYDYIGTGAIGTDAIKVAMIYKPASVTPVGNYAILDSSVDPRFLDDYNRPALAVSFKDNLSGHTFTVVVNHLKSKGSDCDAVGDPDLDDGAGNCNITRSNAAAAEVDWLATNPTNAGTGNIILIGDFNSYDKEDPIDIIKAGADDTDDTGDDYLDMVDEIKGDTAYGYVYDAQVGYLDYALANVNMSNYIVDVDFWHINADEPDLIDYDMSYKEDAQDLLYEPDAYRSSDHDPVVITVTFPPFIEYLMPIFFH